MTTDKKEEFSENIKIKMGHEKHATHNEHKQISQELIQKLTFDPEHPANFTAYNLLFKIVKEENNFVFIDPNFMSEIFHREIFDKKVCSEIWDRPDNFDQISGFEKGDLYIKNYSRIEYEELIVQKIASLQQHYLLDLFDFFLNSATINWDGDNVFFDDKKIVSNNYLKLLNNDMNSLRNGIIARQKNPIVFITAEYADMIRHFEIDRATILFTTAKDFDVINKNITNNNVKPIILNKSQHINILLDFIYRDKILFNREIERLKGLQKYPDAGYLDRLAFDNFYSIYHPIQIDNLANEREIYLIGNTVPKPQPSDGRILPPEPDRRKEILEAILLALKGNQEYASRDDVNSKIRERNSSYAPVGEFVHKNPHRDMMLLASDNKGNKYEYALNPDEKLFNSYSMVYPYASHRVRNYFGKKDPELYYSFFDEEQFLEDPVKWLLYLQNKELKNEKPEISLVQALRILEQLLDNIYDIDVHFDEVYFKHHKLSENPNLIFEELTPCIRGVLTWVSDLTSRLSVTQPHTEPSEYKGVVLLDKLGYNLTPEWEYLLVRRLRSLFPNVQFIISTHEQHPLLMLGASKNATFYNIYKNIVEEEITTDYMQPVQTITQVLVYNLEYSSKYAKFREELKRVFSIQEPTEDNDKFSNIIYDTVSGNIRNIMKNEQKYSFSIDDIITLIQLELYKVINSTILDKVKPRKQKATKRKRRIATRLKNRFAI